MLVYKINYIEDLHEVFSITTKRKKEKFRGIMKRGLQSMALYWHRNYIRHHFTRAALKRYPDAYDYKKVPKAPKQPLVLTGALRRKITQKKGKSDLSGTSTSVTLNMPIGRPGRYTDEMIEAEIRSKMFNKKISWRQAENLVYRGKGYSEETKVVFQKRIPATNAEEEKALRDHIENFITEKLKRKRKPRRVPVRGAGGRFI